MAGERNLYYSVLQKSPVFTDLDSTLELGKLPENMRALQVLRDLAGMVYRLISKFSTPTASGAYSLGKLLKYDPLFQGLAGYFDDASEEQISHVCHILWNAFIPYFFLLKKHRKAINEDWSTERRRSYKMDHDLFFILAITCLFPMFNESKLARQHPSDLSSKKLMKKAENYLGERYEYFLYLLGEL